MNNEKLRDLRAPAYASLALSFALLGDTFLYPFLPVNAAQAGVSVASVGLILSINRFVRILANSFIVRLFGRYGLRVLTIAAVMAAILSTAGYALSTGLGGWLFFRICWGLAFAILRMSTICYALQHSKQGFALGFTRSIQEAGSLVCLLIAPLLLYYFKPATIFLLLAMFSLPAVYFALCLPEEHDRTYAPAKSIFLSIPSAFNLITFISAFLIDGVVIVVLGLLFLHHGEITLLRAASLAAFYLGYKRICMVIISPFGGILADKFGAEKISNICMGFVITGLTLIIFRWTYAGVIVLFTFYGVVSAIMPGTASKGQLNYLSAAAENAIWRDVGAAVGALIGGFLLSSAYLIPSLQTGTLLLAVIFLISFFTDKSNRKIFYLWK